MAIILNICSRNIKYTVTPSDSNMSQILPDDCNIERKEKSHFLEHLYLKSWHVGNFVLEILSISSCSAKCMGLHIIAEMISSSTPIPKDSQHTFIKDGTGIWQRMSIVNCVTNGMPEPIYCSPQNTITFSLLVLSMNL